MELEEAIRTRRTHKAYGPEPVDRTTLDALFDLARELKAKQKQGLEHHLLKGKSVALIFEKSSTRTRVSFEVGVYQLGAQPLFISSGTSQMGRGEPIKDTARTLARYCDGVMIRTYGQEIVEEKRVDGKAAKRALSISPSEWASPRPRWRPSRKACAGTPLRPISIVW